MENDEETYCSIADGDASATPRTANQPRQRKSINLLKRSKHDLLRLLSILEGELEARDIFISTLQAQLNHRQNAQQQYFVHRLTDPFLSLHCDDYTAGTAMTGDSQACPKSNESVHIEPLPLLEKVVCKFKSQQQKMHQQMALASKIHRKMAHELAEGKRRHAFDTKTGDDVTMALEKERERLQASVMCEKERTKRIETEYKKLLALCKEEGRKHKIIVMRLLVEQDQLLQQLRHSRELQIDIDSTETELQAKLQEALKRKQELAMRLSEEQAEGSELKARLAELERQVSQMENSKKNIIPPDSTCTRSSLQQAVALYSCEDGEAVGEVLVMPELPAKMSRTRSSSGDSASSHRDIETGSQSFFAKHLPMSVAQSTQDVTLIPTSCHPPILLADGVGVTTSGYYSVKPGSSIAGLEAIKSSATNKEMLSLDFSREDVFEPPKNDTTGSDEKLHSGMGPKPPSTSGPPKPNRFVPGSPHYTPFRSHHFACNERSNFSLVSSPTSGAANFAMNSPNSPSVPSPSPFSLTRSSSLKASLKFPVTSTEPPTKLSAPSLKSSPVVGVTPMKPGQNSQFQSMRMKFQNPTLSSSSANETEVMVSKETATKEKKFQGKKFTSVTYKSHASQKVHGSTTTLPNVAKSAGAVKQDSVLVGEGDKIKQPLPPKTRPCTAPAAVSIQARPPPLPPKKPSLSSDNSVKRAMVSSDVSKNKDPPLLRKSGSVRRAAPPSPFQKASSVNGNINKNGIHSTPKEVKGPSPPTLPAKTSSQQPVPRAVHRQPLSTPERTSTRPIEVGMVEMYPKL